VISPFSAASIPSFVGATSAQPLTTKQQIAILAQQLQGIAANATNVATAYNAIARTYSVWAIPTGMHMSETLSATTPPCTPGTFAISADGRLGIQSFEPFRGLAGVDELPWSAMAFWDGTQFRGIAISLWTQATITSANVVTANAQPVVDAVSQFYPTTGDDLYRQLIPVVVQPNGQFVTFDAPNTGWQFSSAQNPSANGYYSTSFFSQDDGVWGLQPNRLLDGDTPGLSLTTGGYGFNNYNATEPVLNYYWGGPSQTSANFVGIVFSA
jgi:hypothetical protein